MRSYWELEEQFGNLKGEHIGNLMGEHIGNLMGEHIGNIQETNEPFF
jgi:hypothetical protein